MNRVSACDPFHRCAVKIWRIKLRATALWAPRKIHPCRPCVKRFQGLSDRREQLSWYFSRCPYSYVVGQSRSNDFVNRLLPRRFSWAASVCHALPLGPPLPPSDNRTIDPLVPVCLRADRSVAGHQPTFRTEVFPLGSSTLRASTSAIPPYRKAQASREDAQRIARLAEERKFHPGVIGRTRAVTPIIGEP